MNLITNFELLIYATLLFTPPLLIAALGLNLTTCSGIINIGVDGFMTIGAFVGCASTYYFKNPLIGILLAGFASLAASLIFYFFVLKLHINEILIGFTLNIFLPAIVIIASYAIFNSTDTMPLPSKLKIPILFRSLSESNNVIIKFLSNIFSTYSTTYLAFLLVFIFTILLNKTKIGLYIRACKANQYATSYIGVNVNKLRFYCILVSGFFYGISGAIITMAISNQFKISSVCGQGYIAIAAVLFSDSKPILIMLYCLLFGFFSGLKIIIPANTGIIHLIQILPYLATIIVLIFKSSFNKGHL